MFQSIESIVTYQCSILILYYDQLENSNELKKIKFYYL